MKVTIGIGAALLLSVLVMPAAADDDVFIFYSLRNRALWNSVKPALSSHELREYKVDLLAVADYSAKQRVVARADRSGVTLVVGPRAGEILSGTVIGTPLVGVEVSDTLRSGSSILIYLNLDQDAPPKTGDPVLVRTAEDIQGLDLEKTAVLRVEPGADIGEIAAALVRRLLE